MLILITLALAIAGLIIFGISLLPILMVAAKYIVLGYLGYCIGKKIFKNNKKDDND